MSSVTDGISSVNSLTTQINSLKEKAANASASADPNAVIFNLQQNFNDMLNELVSSSDQEKEKEKSDPFSFIFTNYQAEINNINKQNTQTQPAANPSSESSLSINSYTGSLDNSLNQNIDQAALLQTQYQTNLDGLF
jgi:hypothetical protein